MYKNKKIGPNKCELVDQLQGCLKHTQEKNHSLCEDHCFVKDVATQSIEHDSGLGKS